MNPLMVRLILTDRQLAGAQAAFAYAATSQWSTNRTRESAAKRCAELYSQLINIEAQLTSEQVKS